MLYSGMLGPLLDEASERPGQDLEGAEEVEDCVCGGDPTGCSKNLTEGVRISDDLFDLVLDP